MSEISSKQFTTFHIDGRLYGIDVLQVQEVTRALPIATVPLAPPFVKGLINLRGQISTAICLRDLFKISGDAPDNLMNVVCRENDILISLIVDSVGDVLELDGSSFEDTPDTLPQHMQHFIDGVYKTPDRLLSVVSVEKITNYFTNSNKEIKKQQDVQN